MCVIHKTEEIYKTNAVCMFCFILYRFVRFVSTPEVLERFVTIEKEIVQIEGSIQSSDKSNLVEEAEGMDGKIIMTLVPYLSFDCIYHRK